MALFLNDEDVKELLTLRECLERVELAYKEKGLGRGVNRPRENVWLQEGSERSLKVMPGALTGFGAMGLLVYPGGFGRIERHPFIHILFDANDGRLLAILWSKRLSDMRTGATGAIAVKHLARKGSSKLGLFGSGVQASWQLRFIAQVVELELIKVYSPNRQHREAFAHDMRKELGLNVEAVDSPRECVRRSEIIVTATKAREPVFSGSWLEPGSHINAIGAHYPDRREVDGEAMRRSSIFVDDREQALLEKGEIILAMKEGAIGRDAIKAELGEVVAGIKEGRVREEEITFFGSGGIAIEYLGLTKALYEKASALGLGREIMG